MPTYTAGSATVDILPSLRKFHSTIRSELKGITPPDITVGVIADTKRVTRQLSALKAPTLQMRVEADKRALAKAEADVTASEKRMAASRDAHSDSVAQLDIAEKKLNETRSKARAVPSQIAAAELKVAQARRAMASASNTATNAESALNAARNAAKDAKAKVDVDTTSTSAKLKAFAENVSRAYKVRLGVDPDLAGAEAKLAVFKASASKLAHINGEVSLDTGAATAKLTAMSAVGATVGAGIAGGIGVAGAAILALPAAIAAVLGPIAALTAGLQGVPAAFKAFSQADDQAAQNATANAKAHVSAARQIVSARQQVTQAQTQLSRAYEDASQAQVSAARRVQDAERQVITAQKARLQAQQDLTRAVEDARRAQQDLAFQVQTGALAERAAVLDLADAKKALDDAQASGVTGADLDRVQLAYEQQSLTLDELRARNANLAQDQKTAAAAGVAGSDQVVAAQQRVADASQGVADAHQGVQDAQAAAAQTQVQAQRSIADAQLQVANAQSQLTQALQDAGTVGGAAVDKINAAMAKLSPNAQQFVKDVRSLAPEFDAFKKTIQDSLFAGLGPAFADFGRTALPAMAQNLSVVSGAINGVTKDMLAFLSTKEVAGQFAQLFAGIGQVITASGPVVQTFVGLFLNLATAAMPGIVELVNAVGTIGKALAAALQPLIASGAITQAVSLLAQLFASLAPILAQVLVVAVQLWNAIGPTLISVVQALTPVIGVLLDAFLQMAPTLSQIVLEIAKALLPVVQALAPVLLALLPPISTLISAGLAILVPLIQTGAQVFMALMPAIQAVAGVIASLVPVIVPLIQQLLVGLLPVIQALTPVIAQLAQLFLTSLANILMALIPVILQVVNALLPMIPVFAAIITTVVTQLMPIFQPLMDAFLQLILAVAPLLPPLLELVAALLPAMIAIIGTLMPIITTLASIFVNVLAAVIDNVILPVLKIFVAAIKILSDSVKFLYDSVIKPVWDAIGAIIDFVWTKTIKPVFDFLGAGAKAVGDAFKAMSDTISGIWTALKNIVHGGIQAIVDIVYNNGIRKLANLVIKYIPGVDYLPELKIPAFAGGGVLPGYAPGRDTVPAMLSPGEAVLVPELVRALGPSTILTANATAMRGRGFARGGIVGLQRFAEGGIAATTAGTGAGTAVTIDPAAVAALGDIAEKATAQFTALATTLTNVIVPAVDGVITIVAQLTTQIQTVAIPTVLSYGQETTATATLVSAQWTVIAQAVYTSVNGQTTALTGLQNALGVTRSAMQATADWAVSQFDRIRGAAADPIRWVLTYPFNAGLINAWNQLDGEFAFNRHINPVPIGFAVGGRVFGSGTGTSDSIDARLSAGEFVVREAIARRIYPFLSALNGGSPEALQATGYASGGIVAETGSQLTAAVAAGIAFAKAQDGKPYIWGGVGPAGYDCSGYMSAITNVLRGDNPYRRLGTAASQPWPGFVPGLSSAFATGFSATHTAGTLAGLNVESGGSPSKVKFGIGASGADSSQFGGHASLPLVGGQFVSGGGGVDFAALVGPYFADTYRMLGQVATLFAGNLMGAQAAGVGTNAADSVKSAAVQALTAFSTVTAAAGSPEVMAAVRAVAARFGWGSGPEWDALSQLIAHESGWNPNAANPTSSARGLFQKMTSINGPLEPTVAGQAEWGLGYIKGRYGSPAAAWAQWLSRSPHWYDQGGILPGTGWFYKNTNEPERVLSPAQTRAFDSIAANITSSGITRTDTASSGGQFTGELYLSSGEFLGMVDGRIERKHNEVGASISRGIRT